MKKTLSFIVIMSLLWACQSKNKKQETSTNNDSKAESTIVTFSTVKELLINADKQVDHQIKLIGIVTHTCKHSGKRCFIADEDGEETIRIEAGGKINGFNQELIGSTIAISGTLKERRLTKEYIDQWEESVKENAIEEDGTAETCAAENSNIKMMRDWMKEHGKDYYSIYYIAGIDYDIVK